MEQTRVWAVLLAGSLTPRLYGVVPFQIRSGGDESPVVQYALLMNPNGDGESDSKELILFQNGVLALPGTSSLPNGQKSAYVRLMFSLLPPDEMAQEAPKRLRIKGKRREWEWAMRNMNINVL
ncbi:hypothetical protein J3R82DRAFT_11825 [Butyriboletus roseoflavus]|nr:hypothetical protein J3R82DRAFT_11825 [Butyriboletus roseoflavus]